MCQELASCKLNEPNVTCSHFLKDSVDRPEATFSTQIVVKSEEIVALQITHTTPATC